MYSSACSPDRFKFSACRPMSMVIFIAGWMAAVASCGLVEEQTPPAQVEYAGSGCDGLSLQDQQSWVEDVAALVEPHGDYCDNELLVWQYDGADRTLSLLHQRLVANCSSSRKIELRRDGDTLVVDEVDLTTLGQAASCECVFDLGARVEDVASGSLRLRLERSVVEDFSGQVSPGTQFEGELDLAQGGGVVVLSDASTVWCEP